MSCFCWNRSFPPETVTMASGCEALCIFVNDDASAGVLEKAAGMGIHTLVLRSAGFNNVDLAAHAG